MNFVARTFFNAMSLGFMLPAVVLGAGLLWLNDQSPASVPVVATIDAETSSTLAFLTGKPSVGTETGTATEQPSVERAPPAVAIAAGGLGESSRTELATKVQRELVRLGCLQDAIDGVWSEATSGAARSFVQHRQLGVPTDAPSNLLLLMLESDRSNRCSLLPAVVAATTTAAASETLTTTSSGTVGDGRTAVPASTMPSPAPAEIDASSTSKRSSRANAGSAGNSQSTFSILHGNAP